VVVVSAVDIGVTGVLGVERESDSGRDGIGGMDD
jgi:hypothetical protein